MGEFTNTVQRMEEDIRIQLFQSVDNNDIDGILQCKEEGIEFDILDSNGQTPLIIAAEKGYLEMVNELLAHNVDANIRDDDGWTALIAASKEGHVDIVCALLDYGAKHNITDMGGWTPLVWSSYKGHDEIVKELLHHGTNPNERGQHNMTALIWAAGRGHLNVVNELIKGGAKPEVADKYGTTALIWACRKGHYDVVNKLITERANCNVSGTHGWTPLIMAAKGGYTDVVALLLEENPNINAIDQDGRSALSWSSKEGHGEIVQKLIQKGAFVNMPDRHGDSPLIHAASEGHIDVVKTLIGAYADIEMTQLEDKTALYIAVEKGHVNVVKELLRAGANTEATNKEGETALLRGAKKKHTHCVRLLLEKGAMLDVTDKKGDTALHVAVRNKFAGMCEVLMNDSKNSKLLHRTNKSGETPYSLDARNKPSILVKLFTGSQICQNDFDKMDAAGQQDLLTSTVGEFMVETSLSIPLTVGIYSKWGAGKSNFLQRLMEFFHDYKEQEPIQAFSITMRTVIVCMVFAVTSGLLVWSIASSWGAGIATAVVFTILQLFILSFARLTLVSTYEQLHKHGVSLTNYLNRLLWFLRLVYCIPPSIEELRHMLPVHVITVDLSHSVIVGDNPMTSLVNFTQELNDAVERDIGIIIPRLYRIFQSGPYRARTGSLQNLKSRWKISCCCIPSFCISAAIIVSLWVGLILFGVYGLTGPNTAIALQIACCCIFGGALLANTLRLFVMIYCLALPMKKRVKILSTQSGMNEDTFLAVLKQELDIFIDMLECMDGFAHRQTRVVMKLDLLDSLEQQKVLSLINAINLLVTEPGHPFILLLSVDPRLLIKAVDQTLATMPGPIINPTDYLKNLIDLPFYLNDQVKGSYDGLIPLEIRHQLDEQNSYEVDHEDEMEWDANGEVLSRLSTDLETINGKLSTDNTSMPLLRTERSVKFPSNESINSRQDGNIMEDISHLLRNNENGTLTDVKRIMNIVSLKGRILRNSDITFQWTRLAIWVSLCDGWPHKSTWMSLLCLDSSLDLPGAMTVKNLHMTLGYAIPVLAEQDTNSENTNAYFETFVSSHKPILTINDVRLFAPFMFYVDPTIRKLMVDYLIAMKSGSVSKQPSLLHALSSRSNYPLSPSSSSNKFMWRTVVEDSILPKLTVGDVAAQLREIEGIDESLIATYESCIHDNNINGPVLVTCDLNELREAMQMKFGDWQLFKAWILASRHKEVSTISRSMDKASSYRSSSRNMSYGECSQTESIPDSPKTLTNIVQRAPRLPALTEASVANNSVPYTSHSPRSTPNQSRRSFKHKRPISKNSKSISQDSESGSSPLKGQQTDTKWQRSADSGFASTDVDPTTRLALSMQRNENSLQHHAIVDMNNIRMDLQNNNMRSEQNRRTDKVERPPNQHNSPEILVTSLMYQDTWNNKSDGQKPSDVLSSGSSEYVAIDIDDRKTWKFAKMSDTEDEHSGRPNEVNGDIPVRERPPSFSEVPLPPVSMLNDTSIWPMNPPVEFDDVDDDRLPSPPVTVQRKNAFQNSQLRGMSNYASISESEQLMPDDDLTRSSKSDSKNLTTVRASNSSLKKGASNDNIKRVSSVSSNNGFYQKNEESHF